MKMETSKPMKDQPGSNLGKLGIPGSNQGDQNLSNQKAGATIKNPVRTDTQYSIQVNSGLDTPIQSDFITPAMKNTSNGGLFMLPPLQSHRHMADNQNQSYNINDFGSPHKMQYPYSNSIDLKINGPLDKDVSGKSDKEYEDQIAHLEPNSNSTSNRINNPHDQGGIKLDEISDSSKKKKEYDHFKNFDESSLFILNRNWRIRKFIINVVISNYFDYFMTLIIILNSLVLAMNDYQDDEDITDWNKLLNKIDAVFTYLYFIECFMKIFAYGFIIHQNSYLRNMWNILDFIVVGVGIISFFPAVPNLKSLRTFRILRPLRTINAVPSLKRLVQTLLASLPKMGFLVVFLLLFMGVMSILGIQLFTGKTYWRCRLTDAPYNDETTNSMRWDIDADQERLCGGYYQCNPGTYCHSLLEYEIPIEIDELWNNGLIQYGYFQFDNMGSAILAIFRCMTLEGWSGFMYLYLDSSGYIAFFYFPLIVVIGNFFLLKLFLAVIMTSFEENSQLQKEKLQQYDEQVLKNAPQIVILDQADVNKETAKILATPLTGMAAMIKASQLQKKEQEEAKIQAEKGSTPEPLVERDQFVKDLNLYQYEQYGNMKHELSKQELVEVKTKEEDEIFEKVRDTAWKKFRGFFLDICMSNGLTVVITFCIIANTVILAMDSYPVDEERQVVLDTINTAFFGIFFFEMITKLIGMGPISYVNDSYNIFDGIIICLSIIDVALSYANEDKTTNSGKGAISAFRAFRLMRVFKLAKSWKQLNFLLTTIVRSLKDISSFGVLVFLMIFIFTLLGLEFFSIKNSELPNNTYPGPSLGIVNFNTFFCAIITVFTVLTGENWDSNMFYFSQKYGYLVIVYYFLLVVVGIMIFVNLFVTILLNNFDNEEEEEEEDTEDFLTKSMQKVNGCWERLSERFNDKPVAIRTEVIEEVKSDQDKESLQQGQTMKIVPDQKLPTIKNQKDFESPLKQKVSIDGQVVNPAASSSKKNVYLNVVQELDEESNMPQKKTKDSKITLSKGIEQKSLESQAEGYSEAINYEIQGNSSMKKGAINELKQTRTAQFDNSNKGINFDGRANQLENTNTLIFRNNSENRPIIGQKVDEVSLPTNPKKSSSSQQKGSDGDRSSLERNRNQSMSQKVNVLEGNSLFIFSDTNFVRMTCLHFINHKYFDNFVLVLIGLSSIFLAMENPLNNPQSNLVSFLVKSDFVLTSFFTAEAVLKIIVQGLLFNKENSYLRNGWNIIDIAVVIISIVSLSITSSTLKIIKILRLMRVLRPLRVISRNRGLKIAITALFKAIPNIVNVIIVAGFFYLIYGIIAVNYFKGTYYNCQYGDSPPDFADMSRIVTKWDCLNYGGVWVNSDSTFDTVPSAMITLFRIATTEGWIDFMNEGINSVGIDQQPIPMNNQYWALFFVLFIFLGTFLIMELFTGVVVSTFNRESEKLMKNYLLTDNQQNWIQQKKLMLVISPKVVMDVYTNQQREKLKQLLLSPHFDIFILICITLNTVTLTINWYAQPLYLNNILDIVNYTFAIIFAIEAIMKIIGFGPRIYFRGIGNIFDFTIVISSIITTTISLMNNVDFGASTTFIRVLRLTRIFKYVKKHRQISVLLETLVITAPALSNIGALLLLFIFIFAVLGVNLFSTIQLQNNVDVHGNYQSFTFAFFTLLRCATGETWDYMSLDLVRQNSILFQCDNGEFDYDEYVANGYKTTGCGTTAGMYYAFMFQLAVPLIFLNLFTAIIIDGFENSSQKDPSLVQEEDLEKFKDEWAPYDPDGTGYMKISDLPEFMMKLGEPLGWNESIYRDNQKLQDDFLEEMDIPTYNNFREVLFWEMIQALTKIYMINLDIQQQHQQRDKREDHVNTDNSFIEVDDDTPKIDYVQMDKDRKVELRLELEFENKNNNLQEVVDVEEMKVQEERLMKTYKPRADLGYTLAYIKAGRKIMQMLKRLRANKIKAEGEQLPQTQTPVVNTHNLIPVDKSPNLKKPIESKVSKKSEEQKTPPIDKYKVVVGDFDQHETARALPGLLPGPVVGLKSQRQAWDEQPQLYATKNDEQPQLKKKKSVIDETSGEDDVDPYSTAVKKRGGRGAM